MNNHRELLINQYHELCYLLDEGIDYIPDSEIEFLVREMSIILEHVERHIDEEG